MEGRTRREENEIVQQHSKILVVTGGSDLAAESHEQGILFGEEIGATIGIGVSRRLRASETVRCSRSRRPVKILTRLCLA